ncbi:Rhamnan synthesis protein F [Methylobacterium sp. 275MFSha3.1]|uniref:rhamnan synthesis F family protein n=1 Tax=Methylobacterium sp. 275MFSha3.1 TaxID=1502746 RepID=UPI0008A7770B|nr:rhamnan synthesis F family protein [Methylobacterium sp. 275MFSha3.1]SEI12424.1 Rhamnan synthesis protein F [Methylobacterium sp. 275MFSha3.1]
MTENGDDPAGGGVADGRAEHGGSVDPVWYKQRYLDVAAAGLDPLEHYLSYGYAEKRFPNPMAEIASLGEVVDASWYRARYPDVAETDADPLRHYLLYGRSEGRYPSADHEPRKVWDTRFDPAWYRARNADLGPYQDDPLEHFRRIGILEGRAANASEEDREAWRGIFDPAWYLARNPDVAQRGLNPLEHFIVEGLIDRRRPNAATILESEPVTAARIDRLKGGAFTDEVALFVTHSRNGAIKPHVAHHIASLRQCGIECALIVACDYNKVTITGAAFDIADHVFQRANAGFDFAAWAHLLRLHPELLSANALYLVNDSVFGPTHLEALERVVARVRASESDIVGLTENADRGWHIQSYFLTLKRRFLDSEAGRAFFEGVVSYAHKNDVVNEYETQLARYAMARGFRAEVLFPTPNWLDATLHNWRKLLRAGFPYLKVGTARGLVRGVETADWRAELGARGYNTSSADRTLAQLALGSLVDGVATLSNDTATDARICLAEMHTFLADGGKVVLPDVQEPVVSFIAIVDNTPERLLRVVRAFAEGDLSRTEFIIIDNGTTDDTHHVLQQLPGATVVTNVAPLPSLRAARQGLALARAGIVVILQPLHRPSSSLESPILDASHESEWAALHALRSLLPASICLFQEADPSDDAARRRTFITHRGGCLGTASVMQRREATNVLELLMDSMEQSQA